MNPAIRRQRVKLQETPNCRICGQALLFGTDGNGMAIEWCPRCRRPRPIPTRQGDAAIPFERPKPTPERRAAWREYSQNYRTRTIGEHPVMTALRSWGNPRPWRIL